MKYISTTDLRTKSSELISDLKAGASVTLIHRSEVVGTIMPLVEKRPVALALDQFLKLAQVHHTTPAERRKIYEQHLNRKYGHSLS